MYDGRFIHVDAAFGGACKQRATCHSFHSVLKFFAVNSIFYFEEQLPLKHTFGAPYSTESKTAPIVQSANESEISITKNFSSDHP